MAGPRVGDSAPEFELPGTGGRAYRLADYRGSGVVLAFYPGDFTPACTRQFRSYGRDTDRIGALGVELLGISPQSISSHERFRDHCGTDIPLLADEDKSVARAYGVLGPGGFVRRSIFVVDRELVIRHRKVALVGLTYEGVDDLERAVAAI